MEFYNGRKGKNNKLNVGDRVTIKRSVVHEYMANLDEYFSTSVFSSVDNPPSSNEIISALKEAKKESDKGKKFWRSANRSKSKLRGKVVGWGADMGNGISTVRVLIKNKAGTYETFLDESDLYRS